MRLIYEKGRPVGPDPIGHYVYLWRDGDKNIYIGQGVAYRWQHHLKRGDPYFLAYVTAALNMEPATLRKLLDVVEWRLSDRNNPRFPEIETIGALYLEGVRGESGPKRAVFATPGPKAHALAAKAWARRGNARG